MIKVTPEQYEELIRKRNKSFNIGMIIICTITAIVIGILILIQS